MRRTLRLRAPPRPARRRAAAAGGARLEAPPCWNFAGQHSAPHVASPECLTVSTASRLRFLMATWRSAGTPVRRCCSVCRTLERTLASERRSPRSAQPGTLRSTKGAGSLSDAPSSTGPRMGCRPSSTNLGTGLRTRFAPASSALSKSEVARARYSLRPVESFTGGEARRVSRNLTGGQASSDEPQVSQRVRDGGGEALPLLGKDARDALGEPVDPVRTCLRVRQPERRAL